MDPQQPTPEGTPKCPFLYMQRVASQPSKLNLKVLNATHYLDNYDYAKEFATLDMAALKADLKSTLTTSQDWWPADYGHYGPLMVRLAWHSAGTYRIYDGRGGANTGNQRFAPLNSWPDNGNLDKARRLLWPIKQKYGKKLSWGDLMILAANVGMEDMGFPIFGFAGGRVDCWETEEDIYWGPESVVMASERYGSPHRSQALEEPLGAVQMGLIYVNPEGPDGNPDPLASAMDIRDTFARMAMNDEETVALVAGGHTFGKAHGAAPPDGVVGPAPTDATLVEQGFGWQNKHGSGKGVDTITSGLEGAWTADPAKWDGGYFHNLFSYEWELGKGPGGAHQWYPKDGAGAGTIPDAHDPSKSHSPMMLTSDIALLKDPAYNVISKRFHENPKEFEEAFAKAWYKLTHRDMGPVTRCVGPEVAEPQLWQDPCPAPSTEELLTDEDVSALKTKILEESGLSIAQLVATAWASACTFRRTDYRGGAAELAKTLEALEAIQGGFAKAVSLADLLVLGGCAAVEAAAKKGGREVSVPFAPGRTDASQEQTDVGSFAVLEPTADGFRNYRSTPHELIDRAHLLGLTAPEMTVLVAGMRVLNTSSTTSDESNDGVLTTQPETLTNDFLVNLLDMSTQWSEASPGKFEGKEAAGAVKWTATSADLVFGSNPELRAIAEHYACDDAADEFVQHFVLAFAKVMNNDRFDLAA